MIFINATYPQFWECPWLVMIKLPFTKRQNTWWIRTQADCWRFQVDDRQGVNRLDGFMRAYQEQSELLTEFTPVIYKSGWNDASVASH